VTGATTHREVERKFRVHGLFAMPDLAELAPKVESLPTFAMTAVYHDTVELSLFRWGITLRRREGGGDEGWHMKLPVAGADGTTRDEMHVPLAAGAVGSVPGTLIQVVTPLLHELPLEPVIELNTERTPTVLSDDDGTALVEVVDDVVTVSHEGRVVSVFREVEVETLVPDDARAQEITSGVSTLLLGAGAEPSSVSKAASVLGPRTAEPPDVPAVPFPHPSGLAVDAIRANLARHVRALLMADIGVRRDLPDSVHQMRVSARRLRSTFATFAPLLDEQEANHLKDELRWMANELGAIRDTEVMIERLDDHAGHLSDHHDTERCQSVIDPFLGARLTAARSSALAALRSDRHQQLVDDLIAAAVRPPVNDAAYGSCEEVLLPLVTKSWRRLERSVAALSMRGASEPWHDARIRAKRARYAAEAVADVFGKRMRRLAAELADVTEILGDHQDAFVAQGVLREIAATPAADGLVGLSLGLLHEYETEVEMHDRHRFHRAWAGARERARAARVA